MDSHDALGRGRFFPYTPENHLIPHPIDPNFWYWQYVYYPSELVSTGYSWLYFSVVVTCSFYLCGLTACMLQLYLYPASAEGI